MSAAPAAAQEGWTGVVTEFGAGTDPHLGADPAGNVFLVWAGGAPSSIRARRYSQATSAWGPEKIIAPLAGASVGSHESGNVLVVNADGRAAFVWWSGNSVQVSSYDVATDAWTSPAVVLTVDSGLASPNADAFPAQRPAALAVANDHVFIIWYTAAGRSPLSRGFTATISSARLSPWTGTVTARATLWQGYASLVNPKVATDREGNATAVWFVEARTPVGGSQIIQAARWSIATFRWGDVVTLGSEFSTGEPVWLDVDEPGNVSAVWIAGGTFRMARFAAASGTLRVTDIYTVGPGLGGFTCALDRSGNIFLIWTRSYIVQYVGPFHFIQASRYDLSTEQWDAPVNLSAAGYSFAPTLSLEADRGGNATAVWWWQEVDGDESAFYGSRFTSGTNTWSGPAKLMALPASASAQRSVLIGDALGSVTAVWVYVELGPTNVYRLAGTRWSRLGPDPPADFTVVWKSGTTVSVGWTPPNGRVPPDHYLIAGGLSPGEAIASISTSSPATTFTFVVPVGRYYVRVHAVADGLRSAPSNEIRLDVTLPQPPTAPANLLGLVDGAAATLSWTNTAGGDTPTALWLDVSGSATARVPLAISESVTYAGIPPGTYTVTVVASNASGMSPPSNPVTLTIPGACSGVPHQPTNVIASVTGRRLRLDWSPPADGPAVSDYVVHASGAYSGMVATPSRWLSGAVPSGSYTLVVFARNSCGTSGGGEPQSVFVY